MEVLAGYLVIGVDAASSFFSFYGCSIYCHYFSRVDESRAVGGRAVDRRDAFCNSRGSEIRVEAPRQWCCWQGFTHRIDEIQACSAAINCSVLFLQPLVHVRSRQRRSTKNQG